MEENENSEEKSNNTDGDEMNETMVTGAKSGDKAKRIKKTEGKNKEVRKGRNGSTEKKENLTQKAIGKLTVTQLKEELDRLNLSKRGKKTELQERLSNYIRGKEGDDDSTDEEDTEESEEDERKNNSETDNEESDSESETHEVNKRQKYRREKQAFRTPNLFSIKDVENSIAHFSGDDKLSVEKWLGDFEDLSALLDWNELQKIIYCKRMLQGSAKQFITYESNVKSWKILKRKLIREFKTDLNSALIHKELAKRKRRPGESGRQYVYAMQEIASQGRIETEALIQHIIDGVVDDEASKTILYGVSNLHELKKRFEVYDRMKEKTEKSKSSGKKEVNKIKAVKDGKRLHCYGCGATDHSVGSCTHKDKGPKCFKCNEFGHISTKCTKAEKKESAESVNVIRAEDIQTVPVMINGSKVSALLDTGSDVNLIRKDVVDAIGVTNLQGTTRIFTGLGNAITKLIGKFYGQLGIGEDVFKNDVFVVPAATMMSELILGRTLLSKAEVLIQKNKISIKRVVEGTEDEERREVEQTEDVAEKGDSRKQVEEKTEKDETQEEKEIRELMLVTHIEHDEYDVAGSFKSKLNKLIQEYKPKEGVRSLVQTKIVLSDNEPVNTRPRRLAPKEKHILDEQIKDWKL